jgi:hypothetical protein
MPWWRRWPTTLNVGSEPIRSMSSIRRASGGFGRTSASGRGQKTTRLGANGVVELSPCDFLGGLADLVPPPRKHRHRYHGVFVPNHAFRPTVTAHDKSARRQAARCRDWWACGRRTYDGRRCPRRLLRLMRQTTLPRHRATPKAKLMARLGQEFPVACPGCGGDIRCRVDSRQEPAPFEPEVRRWAKARMASPT